MPTYSARNLTANRNAVPGHGLANNLKILDYTVTCSAALTTSDTLQFGYPPKGFRVVFAMLEADDLDTNASPTITLNIGDSGSASRLFAASTVAQAGTSGQMSAATGVGYQYDGATLVTGTPAANAATGAAGDVRLWLVGYIDDASTS